MTETICLFYVGILIKKNACPLLLPFCPLVCRLEQQVPGSYQQFLASVSICITEWFVGHSCKFGFFHFIVCLLDSIPRCFTRISCTASHANFCMWKRPITLDALGNVVRTILRMESDRSSVTSVTV